MCGASLFLMQSVPICSGEWRGIRPGWKQTAVIGGADRADKNDRYTPEGLFNGVLHSWGNCLGAGGKETIAKIPGGCLDFFVFGTLRSGREYGIILLKETKGTKPTGEVL